MVTVSLHLQSGIYQAILSYKDENGKRKQPWKSTGIKERGGKKLALAKAEEIRAEFEKQLEMKRLNETNQTTTTDILFMDYLLNWLEIIKNTIEPSTYASYNQISNNRIKTYFTTHKIKLIELEPIHIQDFYNGMLQEGLTANTVIHHHAIIRKCLDYAFKMNIISSNPADKIQRPKKEMFIGSYYSESELNELFEKSKEDPMELIILLTAFYGLRRSEVLGLKWNAFDFENKTITIKHTVVVATIDGKRQLIKKDRTKNKSSYRTMPLIDDVINTLLECKEKQKAFKQAFGRSYCKEHEEYVCINPQGKLVRPDYVSEHFKILLKNNSLKHIRFHDLRHSCASLLLARGVSMKAIQEWLGHSNYATTANIYAHLDSNSKQISADALVGAFKMNKETKKETEESDSSISKAC